MAGEQILIIDDKIEIGRFLVDLLAPLGYELSIATSGIDGLAMALDKQPDLILLDLNMPGMSGLEVLEALNRHECRSPVILMTLYGSEDVVIKALRLGVRDYLTKPFQIPELLKAVESALEKTRLQRERERLLRELSQANRQLNRRMRDLATLQAIGRSVAALMPLPDLLRRIVDAALYLSNADVATLFLHDESTGHLHLEAIRHGEDYQSNLQDDIHDSHAEDALRAGQPLWVPKPTKRTGMTGYLSDEARSMLYVPIKLGERGAGVIAVAYLHEDQEPPAEVQKRLTALADYAAIALQNARLYENLRQRAEQLATINRIAHLTTSSLDLKAVMRSVVQEIKDVLHAETATLALVDEERDELVFEVSLRGDLDKLGKFHLKIGQGVVGWVVRHGQALRVNDVEQDSRFYAGVDRVTGFRTHSLLCAPLIVSDKVIGAIEVINKQDEQGGRGLFTEQDEALLQGAAAFIAIAIENARLHETVRQAAAMQAIQQMMVTLSHYINNSLQTLLGTSELLEGNHHIAATISEEVHRISAVLSVLRDIVSPESTVYLGTTQMLDIEKELQTRLAEITADHLRSAHVLLSEDKPDR